MTGNERARPDYVAYLQSAGWRTTRNRALWLAGYRCTQCGGKRALQVHHLTYERLGREWDQDLAVLCDNCHGDHHAMIDEARGGTSLRLYLKIGAALIGLSTISTYADLSEALKCACARLHVPYDGPRLTAAIAMLIRDVPIDPATVKATTQAIHDHVPINKIEALRVIDGLAALKPTIRTMPAAQWSDPEADEREREAARVRAWEMGIEL